MSHPFICLSCGQKKTCAMAGCTGTCVKQCVRCLRGHTAKDAAARPYNTKPLTAAQIRTLARNAARQAGLDSNTADAVAHRVVERMKPHEPIADLIQRVITEHAQP